MGSKTQPNTLRIFLSSLHSLHHFLYPPILPTLYSSLSIVFPVFSKQTIISFYSLSSSFFFLNMRIWLIFFFQIMGNIMLSLSCLTLRVKLLWSIFFLFIANGKVLKKIARLKKGNRL